MEAVDGFEPREEASDPLWKIYNANMKKDIQVHNAPHGAQDMPAEVNKVTNLFP